MKNKNIVIISIFVLTIVLVIVIINIRNSNELKIGKYVFSSSDSIDYSWIELNDGNTFLYSRGQAISYQPSGKYEIQKDKLILITPDGNVEFKIVSHNNTLELTNDPLLNTDQKKVFKYDEP